MRKFALIATLVLVSASAQAGETRNLSMAAGEEVTAAQPVKPVEATKAVDATTPAEVVAPAEAPKFVGRPSPVSPTAEAPKPDVAKTVADKPAADKTAKADKPKHHRYWNEARIIGELHRYGVYW